MGIVPEIIRKQQFCFFSVSATSDMSSSISIKSLPISLTSPMLTTSDFLDLLLPVLDSLDDADTADPNLVCLLETDMPSSSSL